MKKLNFIKYKLLILKKLKLLIINNFSLTMTLLYRIYFLIVVGKNWKNTVLYVEGGSNIGRKVCLFAHFDPEGIIRDYVVYYLQALKDEGFEIFFITTSEKIHSNEILKIKNYG